MNQHLLLKCMMYLFFVGFLTTEVTAQVQVKEAVVDAEGLPLPSGNVLILNENDSTLVKGAISDKFGNYRLNGINPGSYILSISMVGFETYEAALSIGELGNKSFNIDQITLNESIEQLGEVVTTARRPLYEQESVAVSFTWNFGSNEFEKIEVSSGSQEEQNRVGIN